MNAALVKAWMVLVLFLRVAFHVSGDSQDTQICTSCDPLVWYDLSTRSSETPSNHRVRNQNAALLGKPHISDSTLDMKNNKVESLKGHDSKEGNNDVISKTAGQQAIS
jgi:hypothetical protein